MNDQTRNIFQEWFDTVVKGLAAQGWEVSSSGGDCSYRGENGKRCAVGHLIPDDKYNEDMEGDGAADLVDQWGFAPIEGADQLAESVGSKAVVRFLERLQSAHDATLREDDPSECMKGNLITLAKTYTLRIPPELMEATNAR